MSPYIDDGYSIEVKIKFQDGEVSVTYRPAVGDEVQRLVAGKMDQSEFLSKKIICWTGMGLEAVAPTIENIKRLHSRLWAALLDLVCGFDTEGNLKN